MRKLAWFAAMLAVGTAASAQSLEQTYAQMCSGNAKSSETCVTLRKALMEKLQKDGAGAVAPAKPVAATVKPGAVGPAWRVWGPLAGKTLIDENGDLNRFEWLEKGAVLKSTRGTAQGDEVTRYELKTDGSVMVLRDGRPPMAMEPTGKTSFAVLTPGGAGGDNTRWRYSPGKAGIDVIQETLAKGKWTATGKKFSRTFAGAGAIAAAEEKLAAERATALAADWKSLGRMAGKQYLYRVSSGTSEDHILSVDWDEFGKSMVMTLTGIPSGKTLRSMKFTRKDGGAGFDFWSSDKDTGLVSIDDGKVRIDWTSQRTGRGDLINEYIPTGEKLKWNRFRDKKGKVRDESNVAYTDVTGIDRRKLDEAAGNALASRKEAARQEEIAARENKSSGDGMFGKMLGGALMGAMLGGGGASSVEMAVIGAKAAAGGANTYETLTQMGDVAQARADESKRQLDATIAQAQAQAAADRARKQQAAADAEAARAASVADANRIRENAARQQAAAAAEQKRVADEAARQKAIADDRARKEAAARQAEAERNRPVEWKEGIVLCEPRQGSKEWRCYGPLQMNILALDAANTIPQLGLACGSSNGIRDIGMIGTYHGYGCGFGIHPTDRNYPGNIDVPAQKGVYVSDRRVFHCPTSKDAYCRNP